MPISEPPLGIYVSVGLSAEASYGAVLRAAEVGALMALGGALLRTQARPAIGELLGFGAAAARVVRHTDEGIAVQFVGRNTAAEPA